MATRDVDLASADFWELSWTERHAAYRELRANDPIAHFSEPFGMPGPGFYAITRHADIATISRNPKVWSSAQGAFTVADLPAEFLEFFGSLIVLDDPRHARLRRIVSGVFSPRSMERTLDIVARIAGETVDAIVDRTGVFDFVEDVAMPYPLRVMCSLMGIPDEHVPMIIEHTRIMTSGGDPQVLGDLDPIASVLSSGAAMAELVSELASERIGTPTDDLITALAHGEVDGDRLSPQEIGSFFILLVAAGSETTRTSLSHGVIALDAFPHQKQRWLADIDGLMATTIEEIVRYASPVNFMRRTCVEATEVGGHHFEPGDKAIMYYSAANRDPEVFDDPDSLDLRRDPNESIAFGAPGPHFCLGAHLARRELATMFRLLLTRIPDLRLAGEPVQQRSDFLNGVLELPVRIR